MYSIIKTCIHKKSAAFRKFWSYQYFILVLILSLSRLHDNLHQKVDNLVYLPQVILIAVERYGTGAIGVGIWSGVFYGVAGAIGLYSAYRTTGCT